LASVLGRYGVTSLLLQIPFAERVKVPVGLSGMTVMHSLELHEMYPHLFRFLYLCSKQVQELIHSWRLPHSVEDFLPLIEESLDIIISEFNSMEVRKRKIIGILLVLLEPLE